MGVKGMGCIEWDWSGLEGIGWKGIGLGRIGYKYKCIGSRRRGEDDPWAAGDQECRETGPKTSFGGEGNF